MAAETTHAIYNAPNDDPSSIGTQFNTEFWQKKALIEAAKETYFGQMADVVSMPKHFGKTIKRYHYLPMLDDRNINDQGIDADGAVASYESTIKVAGPDGEDTAGAGWAQYFVGFHADTDATAITAAKTKFLGWVQEMFPAIYAAMPHTTIAGDYTLQQSISAVAEVKNITIADISQNDVFVLTWTPIAGGDPVALTSAALGATETIAAVAALFTGHADYADLPFVVTTTSTDTLVCTWDAFGVISGTLVLTKTVGTGANVTSITTAGAWTILDLGYVCTITDSVTGSGNLYASSKDVGTISGKMPTLTEDGGRKNRVGFKRIAIEGSIEKFGIFEEYTNESMIFDTDEELEAHLITEAVKGANEINEDQIQIDLLNGAGVIRYTGAAIKTSDLQGEAGTGVADVLEYADFSKLDIELTNNRTPKSTKMITGSRMVDTKVINAARYMYIGSELRPSIERMEDYHGNQAFIPIAQYGAAGNVARGEIGSVGAFRLIEVPEMMRWEGDGGQVSTNGGYHSTGGYYDVFPMLVIGDASFTTIGFQTDGKVVKFKTKHVKPDQNHSTDDPYGEKGFYSIKWYYGSMILRPERIGLIKTIAEY